MEFPAGRQRPGTLSARRHLAELYTDSYLEAGLRDRGAPVGRESVKRFRDELIGDRGPRLVMSQPFSVQVALFFAVEVVQPELFMRRWRLVRFREPLLLTSDSPVALWSPPDPRAESSIGVRTARAVYLPLDRRTALAMVRGGEDRVACPGPARARQVNAVVGAGAHRWIFHHPDDDPLAGMQLPPSRRFVDELVDVRHESDRTVRELHVRARRPAPGAGRA